MQRFCASRIRLGRLAFVIGVLLPPAAFAEAPMHTDDAGTLDKGGVKIEGTWSRDDMAREGELLFGFSPVKNLELEMVGIGGKETGGVDNRSRGYGFGAKWVPYQNETGWSLGARMDYGHTHMTDKVTDTLLTEKEYALTGLASCRLANGQALHMNLGVTRNRLEGDSDTVGTWGIGYEVPLPGRLQLTMEIFGAGHTGPDKAMGLRYKLAEGLKVSGSVGQGNDRHFGQVGVSWEF